MVALALGIALVLWFFIQTIRHPSKQQSGGKAAALQTYRPFYAIISPSETLGECGRDARSPGLIVFSRLPTKCEQRF